MPRAYASLPPESCFCVSPARHTQHFVFSTQFKQLVSSKAVRALNDLCGDVQSGPTVSVFALLQQSLAPAPLFSGAIGLIYGS